LPGRGAFLTFVAGSPQLAVFPQLASALQQGGLEQAAHALDVFDFEAAAARIVPPAHWGYLMSGVDGEATLRANREGCWTSTVGEITAAALIDRRKV
jgi:hypothetical protein